MREELNLHTNIEGATQQTSSEIIEIKEIKNTPFTAVKGKTNKWFIALGLQKLSEETFDNENDIEKYIKKNMWEFVMKIALTTTELVFNNLNNIENGK